MRNCYTSCRRMTFLKNLKQISWKHSASSCKMFEDVEYVSRCLRDPDRYFGGVISYWGWRFFPTASGSRP